MIGAVNSIIRWEYNYALSLQVQMYNANQYAFKLQVVCVGVSVDKRLQAAIKSACLTDLMIGNVADNK